MKRMLTIAGAVAVSAALMYGTAYAAPSNYQNMPPSPYSARDGNGASQVLPYHYERGYVYGRWGNYVPRWVPVLNNPR
jgi:hypothetical protein